MIKVKQVEFNIGISIPGLVKNSYDTDINKINLYVTEINVYIESPQGSFPILQIPLAGNVRKVTHYAKTISEIERQPVTSTGKASSQD